jgi:hypothetical protein
MRTRIAAVLLCLLLALTLAGCVHADRTVALNSDGSGNYTYAVGLSDQVMTLGGSSLTDSMNRFGEQIKQEGGSYSRYEDNGYSYWKYVRPFKSVGQLNNFLEQAPQTGSPGGAPALDTRNTLRVTDNAGFFSTTFHVIGQLNLDFPNSDQNTANLLKDTRLSVAVTMPNWVSAQHGGKQNGNTVTYTVHFGESATIDVTGGGFNMPHIALVVGGLFAALALIVVGILLARRGNRRPANHAPAFSTSPYYAPTLPSISGNDDPTLPATPGYPTDTLPPPLPESTPTQE